MLLINYEAGVREEEIAAYIGDLVFTTSKYSIAVRKKVVSGKEVKRVVKLLTKKKKVRSEKK